MIFSSTYISSAVALFTSSELAALLAEARAFNAEMGVTGMLLYHEGSFMQALEGEKSVVLALRERIYADPRHRGIITLDEQELQERQFGEWSMGFRDLTSATLRALPGYSDILITPFTGTEIAGSPARCRRLLLSFKSTLR